LSTGILSTENSTSSHQFEKNFRIKIFYSFSSGFLEACFLFSRLFLSIEVKKENPRKCSSKKGRLKKVSSSIET